MIVSIADPSGKAAGDAPQGAIRTCFKCRNVRRVERSLSVLASWRAVYLLVRSTGGRWASFAAVMFVACCSDLTRAALSGLETVAVSSTLCLAYSGYLRESPQRIRWSLLWLVPVVLLRIDGFALAGIALGIASVSYILGNRFSWRRLSAVAIPIGGAGLVYFAWRYQYYGLPLSSTYYSKSLVAAQDPGRGTRQLAEWANEYGLAFLIPVGLAALLGRQRKRARALGAALFLHAAYVVRVGGDWMPFWRFFQPLVPLWAMLLGLGLHSLEGPSWSAPMALRFLQPLGSSERPNRAIWRHSRY